MGAVPGDCWVPCNDCALNAQSVGKDEATLCPPQSAFSKHLSACNRCIASQRPAPNNVVTPLIPKLGEYLRYCDVHRQVESTSVTSAPALSATTTVVSIQTSTAVASPPPAVSASSQSTSSAAVASSPPASSSVATSSALISSVAPSPPVTQISDGQPQGPTAVSTFTGAASGFIVPEKGWVFTILSFLLALF
jgi:hypothetical protein